MNFQDYATLILSLGLAGIALSVLALALVMLRFVLVRGRVSENDLRIRRKGLRAAVKGIAIFSLFVVAGGVAGGSFSQYYFLVFAVPMAVVYVIGITSLFSRSSS